MATNQSFHANNSTTRTSDPSSASVSTPHDATASATTELTAKRDAELEAITEQNQINSPFLRLPADIRNTIYLYAFGGHEIYAMASGVRRFVCMGRPQHQLAWNLKPIAQIMALNLPLVCRQIQFETGRYYTFKYNSFGSTEPQYFKLMFDSFTQEQKDKIEVVKLNNFRNQEHERTAYVGLKSLRNLRLLVLRDFHGLNEAARATSIRAFRTISKNESLAVEIVRV